MAISTILAIGGVPWVQKIAPWWCEPCQNHVPKFWRAKQELGKRRV